MRIWVWSRPVAYGSGSACPPKTINAASDHRPDDHGDRLTACRPERLVLAGLMDRGRQPHTGHTVVSGLVSA